MKSLLLSKVSSEVYNSLNDRVFDVVVRAPLKSTMLGDGLLPLRDLDQLRSFLSSTGLSAFFDLPWVPVYIVMCFVLHPAIGAVAIGGSACLALLTLLAEHWTKKPTQTATNYAMRRNALAEAGRRNAEVLAAMGMQKHLATRWSIASWGYIDAQQSIANLTGSFDAWARTIRISIQFGLLTLGAWLVIHNEATVGAIFAASILVSRSLGPTELVIFNLKGLVATRQSWRRLSAIFFLIPPESKRHPLPTPHSTFAIESVSVAPPGVSRIVVQEVSFILRSGQGVGIIGPSASGKSSLMRALVGIWPPIRGKVRIDGAAVEQWSSTDLGPHIGYLPQEVDLFSGSIAENIARFDPSKERAEGVIVAAKAAGVHELILRLSEGYDTEIGVNGSRLSAGQRQRIALARALYRDPFLVLLDEPNANLDSEGENALTQAILSVRQRGGICIVVAHRPSALAALDLILMMSDGRAQAFGPKEEVLKRVLRPAPPTPTAKAETVLTFQNIA